MVLVIENLLPLLDFSRLTCFQFYCFCPVLVLCHFCEMGILVANMVWTSVWRIIGYLGSVIMTSIIVSFLLHNKLDKRGFARDIQFSSCFWTMMNHLPVLWIGLVCPMLEIDGTLVKIISRNVLGPVVGFTTEYMASFDTNNGNIWDIRINYNHEKEFSFDQLSL